MRLILAIALLWLSPLAAAAAEQGFRFFEPVQPPRSFQVMVHRGLAGQAPENTRRALELCIEDGLEWAEVDVRLTKDGQHVLFHDAKLDGKSGGSGTVREHTLEELEQLDAGAWFAKRFAGQKLLSLNECFVLAKGKIAGDDPWEADTLEWATTSPPPAYNFPRIPVVHSARPLKEDAHPASS